MKRRLTRGELATVRTFVYATFKLPLHLRNHVLSDFGVEHSTYLYENGEEAGVTKIVPLREHQVKAALEKALKNIPDYQAVKKTAPSRRKVTHVW